MAYCYEFKGFVPVVPETTFVHPQAVLIGNVILGHGCYIGPGASLRGDFGRIVIGDGANVQDNCIIHSFPGRDAVVEADGHIGHGAILHGCIVGRNALVGMNAVIMDGVNFGAESIVGAQAFVRGETIIPPHNARCFRELAEHVREVFWMTNVECTELIYVSPAYEHVWGRSCQSLYEDPASPSTSPGTRRTVTAPRSCTCAWRSSIA